MIEFRRAARALTERLFPERRALGIAAFAGMTGIGATFYPWLVGADDPLVVFRLAGACVSAFGLGFYVGARRRPQHDPAANPAP